MRKTLLLLFICISGSAFGQSSVYHPFPQDSVVWRLDCGGLGFSCNCTCTGGVCVNESQRQYYYGADTVINAVTYHQLFMDNFDMDYWQGPAFCQPGCNASPHFYSSTANYVGALREDVAQKKVYFYQPFTPAEQLLYDFNLNVGDTLGPTMVNITNMNRVSLIDSVLIGTEYHRRYWLWDINNPNWTPQDSGYVALIEGIGSTFGLLEYLVMPFEFQCSMACVSIDSVTVYPAGSGSCQFLTAGIGQTPEQQLSLNATPNPAGDQTTLHWSGEVAAVIVYDMLGNKIQTHDATADSGNRSLTLNTATWPQGIYLITATGSGAYAATRLMVTR